MTIDVGAWDRVVLEEEDVTVTKTNDHDAGDWRLRIREDLHGGEVDLLGIDRIRVLQTALNALFPPDA